MQKKGVTNLSYNDPKKLTKYDDNSNKEFFLDLNKNNDERANP